MSDTFKKYCSILNYISDADPELFKVIQGQCLGRMFSTWKGSGGMTFLRPDSKFSDKIRKLAYSANDKDVLEAVSTIQSLIIKTHVSDVSNFVASSDYPNFFGERLPVTAKGILDGDAKITADPKFQARSDRPDIAVYIISGEYKRSNVVSKFKPGDEKKKSGGSVKYKRHIKGGADIESKDRSELFQFVVEHQIKSGQDEKMKDTQRNPSLEALVSLLQYIETHVDNSSSLLSLLATKLSYDTLTSLAIILRPYSANSELYITDSIYLGWIKKYHNAKVEFFCYVNNPVEKYNEYRKLANFESGELDSLRNSVCECICKANWESCFDKFYNDLPEHFKGNMSKEILLAESELRLVSAIMLEGSCQYTGNITKDMFLSHYEKYNIGEPKTLNSTIKQSDIGHYYSIIVGLASSDGLCYFPQHDRENDPSACNLSGVATHNPNIILVPFCKRLFCDDYYSTAMEDLKEKLTSILAQIEK